MSIGFLIAAIVSGIAFFVHWIAGTKEVKSPLLDSGMDDQPKYTLYLVWHCCTVILLAVTIGYVWAAFDSMAWDVGLILTLLVGLCAIWGAVLQLGHKRPFLSLPQWVGFAVIVMAAVSSLMSGNA